MGIVHGGLSDLAPPYRMARPRPDFHLVLATLAGTGRCTIPQCPSRLLPGDLLVVPAGTPCAYGIHGQHWSIAWFHIDQNRGMGSALGHRGAVVHRTDATRLAAAMDGYIEELRTGDTEAAALEARLIIRRLERELRTDLDHAAADDRRRLAGLWSHVERDLRRRWTIGDLASVLHVSSASLFRLCARYVGLRPMEYIARMRMERARHLLRYSGEPVKAVASMVGYGDAAAFSTAYRRLIGRSPDQDRH